MRATSSPPSLTSGGRTTARGNLPKKIAKILFWYEVPKLDCEPESLYCDLRHHLFNFEVEGEERGIAVMCDRAG